MATHMYIYIYTCAVYECKMYQSYLHEFLLYDKVVFHTSAIVGFNDVSGAHPGESDASEYAWSNTNSSWHLESGPSRWKYAAQHAQMGTRTNSKKQHPWSARITMESLEMKDFGNQPEIYLFHFISAWKEPSYGAWMVSNLQQWGLMGYDGI